MKVPWAINTQIEKKEKNSFEPESNQRPKDVCYLTNYSPPLYQLSYRRLLGWGVKIKYMKVEFINHFNFQVMKWLVQVRAIFS